MRRLTGWTGNVLTVSDIATTMRQVTADLLKLVEDIEERTDLETEAAVAIRCGEVLTEVRAMQRMIGDRRAQSVRFMLRQGLSYAEIGAAIGVSRQRAEQLASK